MTETGMGKYADIRRRLAEATGPDMELDAAIWWLMNRDAALRVYNNASTGKPTSPANLPTKGLGALAVKLAAPSFTASLDAALALVEEKLPGRAAIILQRALRRVVDENNRLMVGIPIWRIVAATLDALFAALEAQHG